MAEETFPDAIEVHEGVAWVLGLTGLSRIISGELPYYIDGHHGHYELAADDSHVYLTNSALLEDTGWVSRYPLSTGELDGFDEEWVTPDASPEPTTVRVDEHALYWATADEDSGQGASWMLCKSAI